MKKNLLICQFDSSPIIEHAVEFLTEALLNYTYEYPICISPDKLLGFDTDSFRRIYIGTQSDVHIDELHVLPPQTVEGYTIQVQNDTVVIVGYDERGVLCGCLDFYNKYITKFEVTGHSQPYHVNLFGSDLPDFLYSSSPSVRSRGLWTWGHVIYDYCRYIDNLARLKMNTVIIWNDHVPCNAKSIIDYAHSYGIRVIWGYAWCWDTDCARFSDDELEHATQEAFQKFESEYASLNVDGIYFQSFTELLVQSLNGRTIAEAVAEFVNRASAPFFEKYPNLELQFGLHATSVNQNLPYIKNVDPRIRIVWEDCGAFPFSYIPSDIADFDNTMSFIKEIALLRGQEDRFGVVTKGFTKLDWTTFEHLQGPVCMGVASKTVKRNRVERKKKIWRYLQSYWLVNADKALEAVRCMAHIKNGDLCIMPLVEDGMFEESIPFSVALFSEMLWNVDADIRQLIPEVAVREYVEFA